MEGDQKGIKDSFNVRIIAGGALILAGAGITTAFLLLGADMGDLNGHIRKRLHHLDELDGIVERETDPEEYLVRVDQDPVPEGWETARAEGQDSGGRLVRGAF